MSEDFPKLFTFKNDVLSIAVVKTKRVKIIAERKLSVKKIGKF